MFHNKDIIVPYAILMCLIAFAIVNLVRFPMVCEYSILFYFRKPQQNYCQSVDVVLCVNVSLICLMPHVIAFKASMWSSPLVFLLFSPSFSHHFDKTTQSIRCVSSFKFRICEALMHNGPVQNRLSLTTPIKRMHERT